MAIEGGPDGLPIVPAVGRPGSTVWGGSYRSGNQSRSPRGLLQPRRAFDQIAERVPAHAVGGVVGAGVDAARLGVGAEVVAEVAGGRLLLHDRDHPRGVVGSGAVSRSGTDAC